MFSITYLTRAVYFLAVLGQEDDYIKVPKLMFFKILQHKDRLNCFGTNDL